MKETNALYKNIRLYNSQFDIFEMQTFGYHKTTRLRYDADAISFRINYMYEHNKDLEKVPELHKQFIHILDEIRNGFCEIIHVFLTTLTESEPDISYQVGDLSEIIIKHIDFKNQEISFETIILSDNEKCLSYLDNLIKDDEVFNILPDQFFRFNVESYSDAIQKIYPELFKQNQVDINNKDTSIYVHNFTFQTTENCNLNCSYCYQINKTAGRMNFNTAKKFIDKLLNDEYGYINRNNSPAIIIEFIGGDPLLEINLTRKIYEYFLDRCYELNHPWFALHRLSICTNGMLYFDRDVQAFFKKYAHHVSFNISIDGNKELQDSCRVQPNGEGSYDIDITALNHFNKYHTTERNSKMTLAPENMKYLYDSVVNFINQKMESINLNCVFEEVWSPETATLEYQQLKKLANYILENNLEHLYIAIFDDTPESRLDHTSDSNFCFKTGTQLLTVDGNKNIEDVKVGDHVYTASGSIHKVTRTHSHKSNNNRRLHVSGAFPIECTHDHKVFAKKFLYMGWKGVIHYSDPGFYPVSELKKGDRVALPVLDLSKNGENWITEEIAYALGIYIADGCYEGTAAIRITPGYDTNKYYLNCLINAGLNVSINNQRTSVIYSIYPTKSEANRKFVELCKLTGENAYTKHVPQIIFESKKDIVQKVIDGYMNTDGYQIPDNKDHGGLIKSNTVSKHLANDLLILLRAIGEYPTCYLYRRAGTMQIENRTVNVRDRYEVYYNPLNPNGNNQFKYDETYSILWAGIREIDLDYEEYEVHCPTIYPISEMTNEEHSIIINGVAVANCGGTGSMLALDYKGKFYPCIRYMPSSLGTKCKEQCIGHIDTGMVGRNEESEILKLMDSITRRSQSNDICYDCPIGSSCAWCSGLCHQTYGTANKRTQFICVQMFAEHLANVYYWNSLNIKKPHYNLGVRKLMLPDEWALMVIDEKELELLKLIIARSTIATIEYQKSNS